TGSKCCQASDFFGQFWTIADLARISFRNKTEERDFMNVQHVLSVNRIASHRPQVLKPGQIIQGKIMKLFPDQKAQIQLGSQTIIAQLEASLSAGTKYHFQVQPSDDVVHLRVLGDQLKNQAAGNVMELLQQLG